MKISMMKAQLGPATTSGYLPLAGTPPPPLGAAAAREFKASLVLLGAHLLHGV